MASPFQQAVACFQQGLRDQADGLCERIGPNDPDYAQALHLRGLLALQAGEAARAIDFLQRALAEDSRQPAVHLNLGSAWLRLQQPAAALASFDAALSLRPDFADAWNNRGTALLALARPAEALESFEHALQYQPRRAVLHGNRGRALQSLGRLDAALAALEAACAFEPDHAATLLQRGNVLVALGRIEQALESYEAARALAPSAEAAFSCGVALFSLGRFDPALAQLEASAAASPRLSKARGYQGHVLRALGRHEESLAAYRAAVALEPGYVDALCGIGNALRELGRLEEALAAYELALEQDAACVEALSNLGRVLLALKRPLEAGHMLERLLQLAPDTGVRCNYALGHLMHARLSCCDWRDFDTLQQRILEGVAAGQPVTLPSHLLTISDSPGAQRACAQAFVERNWALIRPQPAEPPRRHDRIRLAYVSADFREHPVSQLLIDVWETHDRGAFETVAIALRAPASDAMNRRIRGAFDHFVEVHDLSDAAIAKLTREREIDIAVDLNGYTDGFRPGLFAQRAAPIQVGYLGYAGTSGAPYMDYLIADRTVIPPADEKHYSERIVYLPDCYLPGTAARVAATPTRASQQLPSSGFVFCCFNNQYKILPAMFELWMRVLQRVDGSVLWLAKRSEEVTQNLRQAAERCGIAPTRLVFAPRVADLAQHLARYPLADLFLDTLPVNAHTTASDALAAGLPLLTCRGSAFAGRVAASLLHAAGLPELITDSLPHYESRAVEIATSPRLLGALRRRLESRQAPLFDAHRFRADLERAYRMMWERSLRGESPEGFEVESGPRVTTGPA